MAAGLKPAIQNPKFASSPALLPATPAGASPPAGASWSLGLLQQSSLPLALPSAWAHAALRVSSLSDAAVGSAEQRVRDAALQRWQPSGGEEPFAGPGDHRRAARALRLGSRERFAVLGAVVAAIPRAPDAGAWSRQQLRRQREGGGGGGGSPASCAFNPPPEAEGGVFVGKAALELAAARVLSAAVAAALGDAAGRSIAALQQAARFARGPQSSEGCAAGENTTTPPVWWRAERSRSAGGGSSSAATAHDKALYAAVRCVGCWGELIAQREAAAAELDAARRRLEEARSSAERAVAHIVALAQAEQEAPQGAS